ncbi:group III truncated hemoglobin [Asticcacaulis sp. EMRT-3]|uniref:group III truncated hemoglobin n=1 Tax=Asticcacaulis sp. EMRT-3 TaxID=3040349 RepID=UPI0024AFF67F|nr:group III truncated hemoglobin [Asticcacaulis sp. EMRT-3]MDI7775631.1 group III truncated hemoglobin [Asticcacaulis sp. EMRT-3]
MIETPPQTSPKALEARQKIREDAAAIGIDEAFIARLVDEFYRRVRQHPHLGPVFDGAVHDWPDHLARLKLFWASVALNAGVYTGRPMQAHMRVKTIEAAHFGEWLFLFEQTLRDLAPDERAVDYFMVRASRIGESLKLGLFYRPEQDLHARGK